LLEDFLQIFQACLSKITVKSYAVHTKSHPSHELKNVHILRQIHVTILTPQMSNLMIDGSTKPQILAEKRIFFEKFSQFSD